MIVVKVELWSAITGKKIELARMMIANEGGTNRKGHYSGRTYKGRSSIALSKAMENNSTTRLGFVKDHPRLSQHVWYLVGKMLNSMEYGK